MVRRNVLLNLGNQQIMLSRGYRAALTVVEVIVVGEHLDVIVRRFARPVNSYLDVMIVQSD